MYRILPPQLSAFLCFQAVRVAYLDLQLAEAAVEGAAWAACDLAGLPLNTSQASLQAYKDR